VPSRRYKRLWHARAQDRGMSIISHGWWDDQRQPGLARRRNVDAQGLLLGLRRFRAV